MGYKARFVEDVIVPIVSGVSTIGIATGIALSLSGLAQHDNALQTKETIAKSYAASSEIFHEYLKSKYNYYNNEFQNDNMTAEEMSEKINAETSTDSIINHLKQNENISTSEKMNVEKIEQALNDAELRGKVSGYVTLSSFGTLTGTAITGYILGKKAKKNYIEKEM